MDPSHARQRLIEHLERHAPSGVALVISPDPGGARAPTPGLPLRRHRECPLPRMIGLLTSRTLDPLPPAPPALPAL